MVDIIAIAVISLIVGSAIWYLIRAKKKGVKCVGCPVAGKCTSKKSCSYGCEDK